MTIGATARGTRNVIAILGGSVSGKLRGRVRSGGADYQLFGIAIEVDARYVVETDDGELIDVRNCGELGALVPTFETRRDGPYASLNDENFLSADPQINADLSQVTITIFDAK